MVRNSQASVSCYRPVEPGWRNSNPFACFRVDLNRDPPPELAPCLCLILRKKLDGLPLGDDGFNQVFIELAFGQQFHVWLWSRRPSLIGHSKKRPQEIGSIDRPLQIHTEVKHIDQITHCGLVQPRTDAAGSQIGFIIFQHNDGVRPFGQPVARFDPGDL